MSNRAWRSLIKLVETCPKHITISAPHTIKKERIILGTCCDGLRFFRRTPLSLKDFSFASTSGSLDFSNRKPQKLVFPFQPETEINFLSMKTFHGALISFLIETISEKLECVYWKITWALRVKCSINSSVMKVHFNFRLLYLLSSSSTIDLIPLEIEHFPCADAPWWPSCEFKTCHFTLFMKFTQRFSTKHRNL